MKKIGKVMRLNKIIRKRFYFMLFLFIQGCSLVPLSQISNLNHQQKQDITLQFDTRTHRAIVNDMIVVDNKHILTCSYDKTIILTNIETGKVEKKFLGEIGPGFGQVYNIALSPDKKYLIAGGWFAEGGGYNNDKEGWIRVYDFQTGKLITVLKGHIDVNLGLKFNSDGKYIVSVGSVRTKLWSTSNFTLVKQFKNYPFEHFKVGQPIAMTQDFICLNNKLIYLNSYSEIYIRDAYSGTLIATNKKDPSTLSAFNGGEVKDKYYHMAASKKYIALTSRIADKIPIYNYNLKLVHTIFLNDGGGAVAFSPNGRYLIAVGSQIKHDDGSRFVNVYDTLNNFKKISSFKQFNSNVNIVDFINNNQAIAIDTAYKDIRIWDIYNPNKYTNIYSNGRPKTSAGIKGNTIIWNNLLRKGEHSPQTAAVHYRYFDLNTLTLEQKAINVKNFKLYPRKYKSYEISRANNHDYLILYKNGKQIRHYKDSNAFTFWSFYKNMIIAGDAVGAINIVSLDGEQKYILQGHTSKITSIHTDGDILVSSSFDKTIKLWKIPPVSNKIQIIKPLATLFIEDYNNWVLWTEEGYFTGIGNAPKDIYFHINQGYTSEAKAISINKLYDHFFRPDLIKMKLAGRDISKYTGGLTYKDVLKNLPPTIRINAISKNDINLNKRTVKLSFNVQESNNGGVGVIRIYQEGKLVKTIGNGKINRAAANTDTRIEEARLNKLSKQRQKEYLAQLETSVSKSINGTIDDSQLVGDVKVEELNNKAGLYTITLPIKAGKNNIAVEAFNKTNTIASYRASVDIDAKLRKRQPKIYVIAAGVNKFEQNNVSNLRFSENDAKSIAKEIKNATRYKTEVTLLIGKQVTKKNISKAIKKIKKKAHLEDKIIFYISTHGKSAKGRLYLVPQNNKKLKNWLNFEDLFTEIQSIAALDQIFIIDACESGKASDIMSSVYDAKASVLAKQSGVHVLMATTKGTFAFESANKNIKHGVFTNNILKALNDKKTDRNKDKKITIIELSDALKDPKYRVEHQFPIIRNVGEDTYIKKVK